MAERARRRVAIVDYGMGNLFSVRSACERVGLAGAITSSPADLEAADALILPGVGAFGDAMRNLERLALAPAIREAAAAGRPLVGICLGLQLLFAASHEFGRHAGLGLIAGEVQPLSPGRDRDRRPRKVPHVGWARIRRVAGGTPDPWNGTLLDGLADGEHMYFVHSFHAVPAHRAPVIAETCYGDALFCAAVEAGNVSGFQFHPERSGSAGLRVYANLARRLAGTRAHD